MEIWMLTFLPISTRLEHALVVCDLTQTTNAGIRFKMSLQSSIFINISTRVAMNNIISYRLSVWPETGLLLL